MKRVCVVGDGLSALATAAYAARSGFETTHVPIRKRVSPIECGVTHGGRDWDCFDLTIHQTDSALLGALFEFGLELPRTWVPATSSVIDLDTNARLGTVEDLLHGRALARVADYRVRRCFKRLAGYRPLLSPLSAAAWLEGRCSEHRYTTLVRPLLESIAGVGLEEISIRSLQLLLRGYLRRARSPIARLPGGVRGLFDGFRRVLAERGVRTAAGGTIEAIVPGEGRGAQVRFDGRSQEFDAVVAAGAPVDWLKLVEAPHDGLRYELAETPVASISVVQFVRRWDPAWGTTIQTLSGKRSGSVVVHCPNARGAGHVGGPHPVYVSYRGPAHYREFFASDLEWIERSRDLLEAISGGHLTEDLESAYVFRERSIDVPRVAGGSERSLPKRLDSLPLHICSGRQHPMRVMSLETEVMAAQDVVGRLNADLSFG